MNIYSLALFLLLGCSTSSNEEQVVRVPNTVPSVGDFAEKGIDDLQEYDFALEKSYQFPPEIFPKGKFDVISSESFSALNPIEIKDIASISGPLTKLASMCLSKDYKRFFKLSDYLYRFYEKKTAYWLTIGNCYLRRGNLNMALLKYEQGLLIEKKNQALINNIALIYLKKGNRYKALNIINEIMKERVQYISVLQNYAILLNSFGDYKESLKFSKKLIDKNVVGESVYFLVGHNLLQMGKFAEARIYFEKISKSKLRKFDIGVNYAISLYQTGDSENALRLLESIKVINNRQIRMKNKFISYLRGARI